MSQVFEMELAGRKLRAEVGKVAEQARYDHYFPQPPIPRNPEKESTFSLSPLIMKKRCIPSARFPEDS